jgi:hypothetical protein
VDGNGNGTATADIGWDEAGPGSGAGAEDGPDVPLPVLECDPALMEFASGFGPAGTSVTTDTEEDGAHSYDPVETTVELPHQTFVAIGERLLGGAGPALSRWEIVLEATGATPASPFAVRFRLDASLLPAGQTPATVVVLRNGAAVGPCSGADGASPDPCVVARSTADDGDVLLTALASTGSAWTFAPTVAEPPPPPPPPAAIRCTVPRLVGKTLAQARKLLQRSNCALGKTTRAYSKKVKKGRIIRQRAVAGKSMPRNAKVNVVVSRGPRR